MVKSERKNIYAIPPGPGRVGSCDELTPRVCVWCWREGSGGSARSWPRPRAIRRRRIHRRCARCGAAASRALRRAKRVGGAPRSPASLLPHLPPARPAPHHPHRSLTGRPGPAALRACRRRLPELLGRGRRHPPAAGPGRRPPAQHEGGRPRPPPLIYIALDRTRPCSDGLVRSPAAALLRPRVGAKGPCSNSP